jgi:dihydrofolate synthase/folylpolyglutamate synthase
MSYVAAIEQLNRMTPELYSAPGRPRRKFSLDEFRELLSALGNPQRKFKSVLIAGTNGKGSTAASLASILSASAVRTGLYSSPHLQRVNERMRVDEEEISDDTFAALFFRVQETAERLVASGGLPHLPSFFEMLTAVAFLHFVGSGVELAVLEVGMGGRLDATNAVDPLLAVITDISLDHTEWLGSTIAEIAREKAGILRPRGTLITLPQHPEANQALQEAAADLEVRPVSAVEFMPPVGVKAGAAYSIDALGKSVEVCSPLWGVHQQRNLALAIAAAVELASKHGIPITAESIATGIRTTRWPGRLEQVSLGGMKWILDVAHNPAGAWALRSALNSICGEGRRRTLIFSCLRDKPVRELAQILFPLFDLVILTPIHSLRAAPLEELVAAAVETGCAARVADSVECAIEEAKLASPGEVVVISGSVYLVGEARSLLLKNRGAKE